MMKCRGAFEDYEALGATLSRGPNCITVFLTSIKLQVRDGGAAYLNEVHHQIVESTRLYKSG